MFRRIPLTIQMLLLCLTVGIIVWFVLDNYQTKEFKNLLETQLMKRLNKEASENRQLFDRSIYLQNQLAKLLVSQEVFADYIEGNDWDQVKNPLIKYDDRYPSWFPEASLMRQFINPDYAFLFDNQGRVREIYRNKADAEIPRELLYPTAYLLQLSLDQSLLTHIKGIHYLIASRTKTFSRENKKVTLMLATILNNEFLINSLGAPVVCSEEFYHSPCGKIVALIDGNDGRIVASNNPDQMPPGIKYDTLLDRYIMTQKEFLDYGASDLVISIASFISTEEVDFLTKFLLQKDRYNHAVSAIVFIIAFVVIIFWITKQKEKEKEYKSIIQTSQDGFWRIGATGNFLDVNDAYCNLTGYSRDELLNMSVADVEEKEASEDIKKHLRKVIETGYDKFETRHRRKDGGIVNVDVSTNYIDTHGGQFFVFLRDITERKKNERLLKKRQREIEELNNNLERRVQEELEKNRQKDFVMMHQSRLAAMGEMLGLIAHQWRQPLSALNFILYNIKLSFEEKDLTEEVLDDSITKGMRLISSMSETIDDFRDFFRANKKEVEFSINKTIKDTFFMVRPGFTHNGISLDIHEEDEVKVIGFQNEYSQVILNIFNNAKDAIIKRTTKGRVDVDVFHKNNSAVVKIRDNGGGIPENILHKVFDPYFTTKGEEKGTGLGLYMSRMIIEDHMDGNIGVANTDEGAEFTITLPLKKSST